MARETRSYYTGGEKVEHADGIAFAVSKLPPKVRAAWAMRYAGTEWIWRQQPYRNESEARRLLEGDWRKVADKAVESQFKVYARYGEIARALGVCVSTVHRWVKEADRAIASAWL